MCARRHLHSHLHMIQLATSCLMFKGITTHVQHNSTHSGSLRKSVASEARASKSARKTFAATDDIYTHHIHMSYAVVQWHRSYSLHRLACAMVSTPSVTRGSKLPHSSKARGLKLPCRWRRRSSSRHFRGTSTATRTTAWVKITLYGRWWEWVKITLCCRGRAWIKITLRCRGRAWVKITLCCRGRERGRAVRLCDT